MFESEVQNILFKRQNTLKLIDELNKIYAPYEYGKELYNQAYNIGFRIDGHCTVTNKAREDIRNILEYLDIPVKAGYNADIETLAKEVTATTIDDFYFSVVRYFPNNKYKDYEFFTVKEGNELTKMQYTETGVHERKLILILNCLWLLDNDAPMDYETRNKIYKLATDGKTFVFKGCKVTRYKNGNLKIMFSSDKLFKEFETRFKKALEQATKKASS